MDCPSSELPAVAGKKAFARVFDLNRTPHQRMARMETKIGGESVRSETDPEFSVRVLRVMAP